LEGLMDPITQILSQRSKLWTMGAAHRYS
jgi:hypothetical protein